MPEMAPVDKVLEEQAMESPAFTPPASAVDITPGQDGGVLKAIRTPGTAGSPSSGDHVFVHYVGTLTDGSKFDSSRDREELFEFQLGEGSVIKAWDIGVATMQKGELAVLYCRSDYAYGTKGSPPKIPPNATLIFEVELYQWKGEDVSPEKDEGILRSVLEKGDGHASPKEGATCQVHINGTYNGAVFEDRDVSIVMGEGSESGLVEGVELALQKMLKGEKSKLTIASKYGYGVAGCSEHNIPADAKLEYEVTLVNFEKVKESWEMEPSEKLEQAELVKQKGTDFFKQGKYKLAMRYYKKISEFLENESSLEDEQKAQREALLLAGHLNTALCLLKDKSDLEARDECDKALKLDPRSEKALFRRATARVNLQDYVEAIHDLQRVLEIDPSNKAAKNLVVITRRKIQDDREKQKELYGGMFQKFAEIDSKKEALRKAANPSETEKPDGEEATDVQHEDSAADKQEDVEKAMEAEESYPAATDPPTPADILTEA